MTPTRNNVEPTTSATDELRRMLDEADEYYKTSGNKTWWGRPIDRQTGKPINVFHYQAQPMGEDRLFVELQLATPEQAIAATLGREPDDAAMAKLHDQMNAAMLKYEMAQGIEKRDEDGAIVVPWVLKMHALLEEAATLGSCNCSNNCTNSERTGTCTADETEHIDISWQDGRHLTIHVMECSECGRTYEHVNGDYEYCPRCGRRIEVNDG